MNLFKKTMRNLEMKKIQIKQKKNKIKILNNYNYT